MTHRPIYRRLLNDLATTLVALTLVGCDDRATRIATQAADRQAQQNREMAQLNREVAAGASNLVTEEAKARQQVLEVHRELQQERSGLAAGWNKLEVERQQIARSRRTESALAAIVSGGGAMLAALLALALAWLVLYRGGGDGQAPTPTVCAEVVDALLSDRAVTPQLPFEPDRRQQANAADALPSHPEDPL